MKVLGTVHEGKVVLDGGSVLPEGARVFVVVSENENRMRSESVEFPLVKSKSPGSLTLSNQRIAELLDDEDMSAGY